MSLDGCPEWKFDSTQKQIHAPTELLVFPNHFNLVVGFSEVYTFESPMYQRIMYCSQSILCQNGSYVEIELTAANFFIIDTCLYEYLPFLLQLQCMIFSTV